MLMSLTGVLAGHRTWDGKMQGPAAYNVFNQVIIFGPKGSLLAYSPDRGPNNLSASVSTVPFTDSYGNQVLPGTVSYTLVGSLFLATQLYQGALIYYRNSSGNQESGGWVQFGNIGPEIVTGTNIGILADVPFWAVKSPDSGFEVWMTPSGDTSGVTDATIMNFFLGFGACKIHLVPSNTVAGVDFYSNQNHQVGFQQYIDGPPGVIWHNLTAGLFAFTIQQPAAYVSDLSAGITGGFTIKCAGGPQGGVEFGDMAGIRIDVMVEHSTGAAGYAHNGNHFSEWNDVRIEILDCARGLVFARTGTGTNSYDRSRYRVYVAQPAGDTVVELGNISGDVDLAQGALEIYGNVHDNTTLIQFNTPGSLIEECYLQVGVENDGGTGTPPQTVAFNGNGKIQNCTGILSFTGAAWTPSDNTGSEMIGFAGTVGGDTTLGQTAPVSIAAGLPAGWTGNVWVRTDANDVFIDVELTIANGTVVTSGEVLVSGLAFPWKPVSNKPLVINHQNAGGANPVSIQVDTSGNLKYIGAGFTASGSEFLFGSTRYSNLH